MQEFNWLKTNNIHHELECKIDGTSLIVNTSEGQYTTIELKNPQKLVLDERPQNHSVMYFVPIRLNEVYSEYRLIMLKQVKFTEHYNPYFTTDLPVLVAGVGTSDPRDGRVYNVTSPAPGLDNAQSILQIINNVFTITIGVSEEIR